MLDLFWSTRINNENFLEYIALYAWQNGIVHEVFVGFSNFVLIET